MARRSEATLQFDALALEGGLFPPEWLGKVAALEAPAQEPADYGIKKGLELRDEITRYWRIAEALWSEFAAARSQPGHDPHAVARSFARQLLADVFDFEDLRDGGIREIDGRRFPIDLEGLGGRVPVVVGSADASLDDSVPRHGDGHRRRSAWGALQEYLNAADDALWGIATNGLRIRLGRDNASLTRPAWFEADLERIFTEERFADFSALWLVLHASRFGRPGQPVTDCPLEAWRNVAAEEGSRARDLLRDGVEKALLALGQGFLSADNPALRHALATGELSALDYYNELLRLVYRMIFLLTVEERDILHPPGTPPEVRALYAEGYGMRRLRERSLRRAQYDRHGDLWASLRPVFTALGRREGEPALGLPGLGGLFAPEQCPHLDAAELPNEALLEAVRRLAWIQKDGVLTRVNWKDMGPEEFGSVYESLLELVPVVGDGARRFSFAGVEESAGNERKRTGSYYTPDALVQQLLDTALMPVVRERLAANPDDPEGALLSITVIDPACGSGHFLLAAARRLAGELARIRAGGTPGAVEYRHALRDVVTHCIFGVDRNPMALELARMALWLEAHTPDRALGFLDHHLVCGDSLLGLLDLSVLADGIPDDAFKPLTGDDRELANQLRRLNREGRKVLQRKRESGALSLELGGRTLADAFARLEQLSDDAVENVEAKRAAYAALRAEAENSPIALAADLYMAAFLMPKRLGEGERALSDAVATERFPTTTALAMALDGTLGPTHSLVETARRVCREARVLHWPLVFPQVFEKGGFDVVLGNPPWERIKLQEQEFFANRAPEIAQAKNKAARERAIAELAKAAPGTRERALYEEFVNAKQQAEATSVFCHTAARFPLTGVGDVNTYALFAETAYRLIGPAGRAGIVVPTGIATDDSTKAFFGEVVEKRRLVSLYDFENREAIFPGVHRSYKFALLTLGRAEAAEFAFFAMRVEHLRDRRRRFRLTAEDFRLINPNTRTCPVFRSEYDAELTKKIYRNVPVLIDETKPPEEGNPWGLSFMTMFHMANDSYLFLDQPGSGTLPLYEAKMIHQFDHRWATYEPAQETSGAPSSRDVTDGEKADPRFTVRPRYWVPEAAVRARLREIGWDRKWLMGWRDICRATDERTVIAAVIPAVGVGHKFLLLYSNSVSPRLLACLLAEQNSLVHDFVARQKVGGTSLNYFTKRQITNLPPSRYTPADLDFIVPRVLELTYTAEDLRPWAEDLGYEGDPFPWDPERRAVLRAELDAYYARLYGLTRDELRYILDPADVMGPDYPSETFRVLKEKEEREFGEYRTKRLVLEAWDRLFGDGAGALSVDQRSYAPAGG